MQAASRTKSIIEPQESLITLALNKYRRESTTSVLHQQRVDDLLKLQQAYENLSGYCERGSRHTRRYPILFRQEYITTRFGRLEGCKILPLTDWYAGHRPGDPIVRIKKDPIKRILNAGDMFYVDDLAGAEDGDEAEQYEVCFEGVVPFDTKELYLRFAQYAFPTFVKMAIAAVGFDPQNRGVGAHPWVENIEQNTLLQLAELKLKGRDMAKFLKLLRGIWHIKYGIKATNQPAFLRAQVEASISSLREIGWLMSQLEAFHGRCHYWNHCKGLLQDFAGCDIAQLAQEYLDITLAAESERLLNDGHVKLSEWVFAD
ncbi:hypothetical protein ONZ43_g5868 [Nemania bipapillata]|uniref:Uncharacterized protein n=1 Tax=Nemania bipapillata TaxID=110536 RepID=A0ACC2I534_9PEZI|nr:hypothetical protein ONZ43_g5868 [Nemania bipapillata]